MLTAERTDPEPPVIVSTELLASVRLEPETLDPGIDENDTTEPDASCPRNESTDVFAASTVKSSVSPLAIFMGFVYDILRYVFYEQISAIVTCCCKSSKRKPSGVSPNDLNVCARDGNN